MLELVLHYTNFFCKQHFFKYYRFSSRILTLALKSLLFLLPNFSRSNGIPMKNHSFLAIFAALLAGGAHAQTEPTPKCELPTVHGDPPCWMKIANHANCYIWNFSPSNEETVAWSGRCRAGKPNGRGKETWERRHSEDMETKANIGSYVNGERDGQWTIRDVPGTGSHNGPYVDGKRHGKWVERVKGVYFKYGHYVDGKKHGQWEFLLLGPDGGTLCTEYSYGEKIRSRDGGC